MKIPLKINPSTMIQTSNGTVSINTLPYEIRNEIETLDKMMQDKQDLLYQLEVVSLAINMKQKIISDLIENFLKKDGPHETGERHNG